MKYVSKPHIHTTRSYVETIPFDEPFMTIDVMEAEKQTFTGLYDHEGNPIHRVSDFKMGF